MLLQGDFVDVLFVDLLKFIGAATVSRIEGDSVTVTKNGIDTTVDVGLIVRNLSEDYRNARARIVSGGRFVVGDDMSVEQYLAQRVVKPFQGTVLATELNSLKAEILAQ